MKRLFLLSFAMLMAVCSFAQEWKSPATQKAPGHHTPAMAGKASIQLAEGQFWWGYLADSDVRGMETDGYLGYSKACTIDAAIHVPENHAIVGNGQLKAVRFWLGSDISAISSDLRIWISSTLPSGNTSTATFTMTVPKASLKSGLNEIELTRSFNVDNQGFYVGYSFSISRKAYPVLGGGEDTPDAFFYRYTGQSWIDFYGYDYGKLALQLLVDGVTLSENSAAVSDFGTSYVEKGNTVNVPVRILNAGKSPVRSIGYTITTNGVATDEATVSLNGLAFNNSTYVNIPFAADADTRNYDKLLTITKVNGAENANTANTASGSLITVTEKPVAMPVVEEFTGTWCGYCPVGIVGMQHAHNTFGDKVALIAVHNDDPMEITDYNAIMNQVSSFPSSFIDRQIDAYPSAYYLNYYLSRELNRTTVASMELEAQWQDESQNAINIDTKTKFVYSDDNGQYGIAHVLVEDGMKGTTSSWAQSNYFTGESGDESMQFWYSAASKVTGLEFDHVAVAAWNIGRGADGSVSTTIEAGEVQDHHFEADIANRTIIQDKSKLSVIALLIDRTNGTIVNAAKARIMDHVTGITSAGTTQNKPESYYTVDGKRLAAPQRGLNIVRMSDKTVRKAIVK